MVEKASVDWLEHLNFLCGDYVIFHFCMANVAQVTLPVCSKYAFVSTSPDSCRSLCPLVYGESLKIFSQASLYKSEDRGQVGGSLTTQLPFPVGLFHVRERWSHFRVSVFTQMLA